jgi:hypothetical protein
MTRVKWTLSVEAAKAIRAALDFCSETGVCGKAFRNDCLKAIDALPKVDECADCDDAAEDPDAEFHATPCGSHCEACMAEHVKECRVCCSQFSEQFPETWEEWERNEATDHAA